MISFLTSKLRSKRHKNSSYKIFFGLFLFLLLIQEYLVYNFQSLKWPKLSFRPSDMKILLVADPQLIGYNDPFCGILERFDSDRYLQNTFNAAFKYLNPNIVLFLGDIFDEGMLVNDAYFSQYVTRLKSIFSFKSIPKILIVPGDNDIGGDKESLNLAASERFSSQLSDYIFEEFDHKFIEFHNVNVLMQNYTKPSKKQNLVVAISHIPLAPTYGIFVEKVFKEIAPSLIFSAHEHNSIHLIVDTRTNARINFTFPFLQNGEVMQYQLSKNFIHEFMVPTCSYRMGERFSGYGAAIIGDDSLLKYTVLWMPDRYFQLLTYLFFVSSFFILMIMQRFLRCSR